MKRDHRICTVVPFFSLKKCAVEVVVRFCYRGCHGIKGEGEKMRKGDGVKRDPYGPAVNWETRFQIHVWIKARTETKAPSGLVPAGQPFS